MIKKFNISKNIDDTGDINLQRCFHDAYGNYPLCYSPYAFQSNKEVGKRLENGELEFDYDSFKDEFIDVLSKDFEVKTIKYKNKSGWNLKYFGFSKTDSHLIVFFNNTYDFFVYYDMTSEENAIHLADKVFIDMVLKHVVEKVQPKNIINILIQTQNGFDLVPQEIKPIDMDVNECFNDDFKPINDVIEKAVDSDGSGLIILHGKQGSGKTTYIRKLINTHNKRFIMLNNSVMNSFTNPTFIQFLMRQKDSVIIVEDCEQLLKERSSNTFNDGISSILNITDGIYSDILNIKIIATFNSKLTDIDPALLRKGRLIAKYDFQTLCLAKTNNLLNKLGYPESDKELTLAEIFNHDDMEFSKSNRKSIGFN